MVVVDVFLFLLGLGAGTGGGAAAATEGASPLLPRVLELLLLLFLLPLLLFAELPNALV